MLSARDQRTDRKGRGAGPARRDHGDPRRGVRRLRRFLIDALVAAEHDRAEQIHRVRRGQRTVSVDVACFDGGEAQVGMEVFSSKLKGQVDGRLIIMSDYDSFMKEIAK